MLEGNRSHWAQPEASWGRTFELEECPRAASFGNMVVRNTGFTTPQTWVQISALPLCGTVTLGKSLPLFLSLNLITSTMA